MSGASALPFVWRSSIELAKRVFDLLLSSVGLVLLSPLLLLIAIAVKLDSPGPVFFRQQRVGLQGTLFRIHKFRSMRSEPQAGGRQITVGSDPRITRVGALLRRHKLDELAQLIDVWQGTMSFVGPRPEVPRYVAMYPSEMRERVLSVRPGITDMASILYRDESEVLARASDPEREYVEVVMPRKLALAVQYARHPSLAQDIRIIGRTLLALLGRD